MMKKICIVTNDLSTIGGQQKTVSDVANMLSKDNQVYILFTSKKEKSNELLYKLNSDVKVTNLDELTYSFNKYPFHVILQKINKKFNNKLKFRREIYFPIREKKNYTNYFLRNEFDIVIGDGPRNSALISQIQDKSIKIGWMHSTFSRYFLMENAQFLNLTVMYKKLFSKLDSLIVLTKKDQKEYKEMFKIQTHQVYNFVDVQISEYTKLDNKSIIFIGRLDYSVKGVDYLIEIFQRVNKINKDIILYIVGDGTGMERLKSHIKRENLDEKIILLGFQKDVYQFLMNSDLCIVTSREEGFGLVVVEAMSIGVPVISFETNGPSEIIEHGENGILIKKYDVKKFADEILYLFSKPEELKRMSASAIRRAKNFDLEVVKEKWSKILNSY